MDRLYSLTRNSCSTSRTPGGVFTLAAALVCFNACEEPSSTSEQAPPARFQAVTVKNEVTAKELAGFCDTQNGGVFELPELTTAPPAGAAGEPRWVNVWATWCKSCVEEMPMIEAWRSKLLGDVVFVSADEDPEALEAFTKKHAALPESLRMKDAESLPEWMKDLSLDAGAGLPLHIFVGGDAKIKCIRAGAVSESHYAIVESLMK